MLIDISNTYYTYVELGGDPFAFRVALVVPWPRCKERIDMAVFPALQGGPHNHQMLGGMDGTPCHWAMDIGVG